MQEQQDPHQGKPWYKHPHVWLLITFPVLAILGGMHMIYLVVQSKDSLVSNSYYKEGNLINQRNALDKSMANQGISAQLTLADDQKSIRVIINHKSSGIVQLKLSHPTLSELDQNVALTQSADNMYTGQLSQALDQGRWYIEISDTKKTWELRKEWRIASSSSINLP